VSAVQNRRQSFANSKQGMRSELAHSLSPIPGFGFVNSFMRELLNASIHNINIYGDSVSPCRIPLVSLIRLAGSSLTNKEYDTEVIHSMIQLIYMG